MQAFKITSRSPRVHHDEFMQACYDEGLAVFMPSRIFLSVPLGELFMLNGNFPDCFTHFDFSLFPSFHV